MALFSAADLPTRCDRSAGGITDRQNVGIRHCTGLSPRAPSVLDLVSNHRPKPTRNRTYGSWAGSSCRTVVQPQQRFIVPVIQESLRRITYAPAGSAATQASNLQECDSCSEGRSDNVVRVENVSDRYEAGRSLRDVAFDFHVPAEDVEEVVCAALKTVARPTALLVNRSLDPHHRPNALASRGGRQGDHLWAIRVRHSPNVSHPGWSLAILSGNCSVAGIAAGSISELRSLPAKRPAAPGSTDRQDAGPRASAISDAHSLITAQSRKSPSSPRKAMSMALSGKLRFLLSIFPPNTRWFRA